MSNESARNTRKMATDESLDNRPLPRRSPSRNIIYRPNGWRLAQSGGDFSIWDGDYLVQDHIEAPEEAFAAFYSYAGWDESLRLQELEAVHPFMMEAGSHDLDTLVRAVGIGLADASEAKNIADFMALLSTWEPVRVLTTLMAAVERIRKAELEGGEVVDES